MTTRLLQRGIEMLTKHLITAFFCAAGLAYVTAKAQTTIKIGVSVPSADHGWTGGIDFFAEETKKRLESLHKNLRIIVKTATGPSDQRKSLEELVAAEQINALVILPYESGPLTDPVRGQREGDLRNCRGPSTVGRYYSKPVRSRRQSRHG
jgi:ribose transport system substrate-binding protein